MHQLTVEGPDAAIDALFTYIYG